MKFLPEKSEINTFFKRKGLIPAKTILNYFYYHLIIVFKYINCFFDVLYIPTVSGFSREKCIHFSTYAYEYILRAL
ncbi:hypothetical protein KsCSTR_00070 [Candidatus Kuenenia stuttgartiensis]|uniref:Uncharacterized protein n=1 Tax=Kuenenia stuttgartiensis TaxID=174633 RepID=Q1PVC3_KUEST|nr:hypothetical protein KsCSTR_00070 [Candidatus Kuenenia stuttgartiensis]CAJ71183.1 unknown protein [Candidatus Kuenenia stuttgartiensis]